jgi:DNA processing protein
VNDLDNLIRLNMVRGIGPVLQRRLVEHFGSIEQVFRASPAGLAAVRGIGPKIAEAVVQSREAIDLKRELELIREFKVEVIPLDSDRYPANLKQIENPPLILYVRGEVVKSDGLAVAMVGTRRASIYGLHMAERLAAGLARMGVTVVSGLAVGVDTSAHRGALKALGRTIAVIGSGLANLYPPHNAALADEIAEHGALVSEFPMLYPVEASNFPRRNRLISGLSLGVVVVEAGKRSGALITARWAGEQGRDVLAVPGRIDSPNSQGPHRLIRDGATLVTSAEDILQALGPTHQAVATAQGDVLQPRELALNDVERRILDQLQVSEPRTTDDVVAAADLPVSTVSSILLILQTKGLVRQLSGSRFVRAEDLFAKPGTVEPEATPRPDDAGLPRWRCGLCEAILRHAEPPAECPFCGADGTAFTED